MILEADDCPCKITLTSEDLTGLKSFSIFYWYTVFQKRKLDMAFHRPAGTQNKKKNSFSKLFGQMYYCI